MTFEILLTVLFYHIIFKVLICCKKGKYAVCIHIVFNKISQ